jgi:predicted membrane chloride channel (bestrophin family)
MEVFTHTGLLVSVGEIENPFGYDWNDLPLDGIIAQLVSDLIQVINLHMGLHKVSKSV